MENKSKLNTVLLVIIIILLVVGFGYTLINNSKQKEDNSLIKNLPQEDQNNIKNNKDVIPAPINNKESNLVAVTSDPFPSNSVVGGASYLLIKKSIGLDNNISYYDVYSDVISNPQKPYMSNGKIYYNPTEKKDVVEFGSKVSSSIISFRESVNQEISKNGYAIVSFFMDGGPDYTSYSLLK